MSRKRCGEIQYTCDMLLLTDSVSVHLAVCVVEALEWIAGESWAGMELKIGANLIAFYVIL